MTDKSIEERIDRLQAGGIIDLHFDLPMDLYEKRERKNVLETEFLPELEAGNIGVVGVAIYIEDRYLPDDGLARGARSDRAAYMLKQQRSSGSRFAKTIAKSRRRAKTDKIALVITMEGVEPLGTDLNLSARLLRARRALNWTYPCAKQCGGTRRNFRFERFIAGGSYRLWS